MFVAWYHRAGRLSERRCVRLSCTRPAAYLNERLPQPHRGNTRALDGMTGCMNNRTYEVVSGHTPEEPVRSSLRRVGFWVGNRVRYLELHQIAGSQRTQLHPGRHVRARRLQCRRQRCGVFDCVQQGWLNPAAAGRCAIFPSPTPAPTPTHRTAVACSLAQSGPTPPSAAAVPEASRFPAATLIGPRAPRATLSNVPSPAASPLNTCVDTCCGKLLDLWPQSELLMCSRVLRRGWSRLGQPTSDMLLEVPHGPRAGVAAAVARADAMACGAESAAPLATRSSWLHAVATASSPLVCSHPSAGMGGQARLGVQRPWLGFAGDVVRVAAVGAVSMREHMPCTSIVNMQRVSFASGGGGRGRSGRGGGHRRGAGLKISPWGRRKDKQAGVAEREDTQEMEGVGKYKLRPDPINVLDLQLTEKQIKSACLPVHALLLPSVSTGREFQA
jgi:hypothetical protein